MIRVTTNKNLPSIMFFIGLFVKQISPYQPSLVTISHILITYLRSQLPAEPIEDPPSWAWGSHPRWGEIQPYFDWNWCPSRNALGYRAKDDHPLEVCLANPSLIKGAKCKIPLDICLENPEWLPLVGCSGEGYTIQYLHLHLTRVSALFICPTS